MELLLFTELQNLRLWRKYGASKFGGINESHTKYRGVKWRKTAILDQYFQKYLSNYSPNETFWAWNWNTAKIPTIRDQNKVTNITEKKISKTMLKFQDICCSCVFCVHMFQKSLSPKKLSLRFGYNYFHPCLNPWITLNNLPLFFDFHSNY